MFKDSCFNLRNYFYMKKIYLIFLTGFYLLCLPDAYVNANEDALLDVHENVQAVESSSGLSEHIYEPTDSGRLLVLYGNPMEEHTVLSRLIIRNYDFKIKKELDAAVELLKKEAAKLGAHAIIVLSPVQSTGLNSDVRNNAEEQTISAKAIRYKHWYY